MRPESKILFTSIPKVIQLKYFLATINFKEKSSASIQSNYNWQKIKARYLLENYDEILVAPVEGKISHLHLIVPKEYFGDTNSNNFLKETNLILTGPYPLHNDTYRECIFYTLTFKLSPEWNQINKYFVKGHNFLSCNEAMESVQCQLLITDGSLALSTWPLRLKLPTLSLIDLGVDFKALCKEGFANVRQKVYVLPQLKTATAIKVHLSIPFSCPLKHYSDMKNHWKNVYGYNLPESEEGMIIIEVAFGWSNFTYSYPLICVCPYEPIQFKCRNDLKIINEFSEALRRKFPQLCRHPVQIDMEPDKIFRPISKLYLTSQVIDKPNLSDLVADSKVIQDFQRYNTPECNNNGTTLRNVRKTRCGSPSQFFPTFGQIPIAPKPSAEKFKCVPIFRHKLKMVLAPLKAPPAKKCKQSPSKHQNIETLILHKGDKSIMQGAVECAPSKESELAEKVEMLARSNNLTKLTVPLLSDFCRKNDIPLKSREKKDIIMQKVYDFFKAS